MMARTKNGFRGLGAHGKWFYEVWRTLQMVLEGLARPEKDFRGLDVDGKLF